MPGISSAGASVVRMYAEPAGVSGVTLSQAPPRNGPRPTEQALIELNKTLVSDVWIWSSFQRSPPVILILSVSCKYNSPNTAVDCVVVLPFGPPVASKK